MTQSLHIKTYFATTVEAAVALARYELGPEAMLMHSRAAPPAASHLGRYEVVFASNPALVRAEPPAAAELRTLLEENGIAPALVDDLLNAAPLTRTGLAARLSSAVSVDATLGDIVALVGPPGRGKTSTLLKLAVKYGLSAGRPIRILSPENCRANPFAENLGITFQSFDSPSTLDRVLDRSVLTFIDSPGLECAEILTAHAADTHLVLRSEARTADLLGMVDRYRAFAPVKLIFTGLDEVETFGNLFSAAVQTGIPISFLCSGPRIPEDLDAATPPGIARMVLAGHRATARAAA